MRACASRCQSSSTSGSIASASPVSPRQSSMSSRAACAAFSTSFQRAEHRGAARGRSSRTRPGADDLGVRLVLAAARRQRLGEPQRAGAGLRRLAAEEGEDLLRRQALTASAARRRGAGSRGRASRGAGPRNALVLVPVARPVAQPDPEDDVGGDRAAGPGGERLRPRPVAGRAPRRAPARAARPAPAVCAGGGRRQPEPEAGKQRPAAIDADSPCSSLVTRSAFGRDYTIACAAASATRQALAVNAVHE